MLHSMLSARAPGERAEHAHRNCPTRWASGRASCRHRAWVALDDEVHIVLKSLKLLRQCWGRAGATSSHPSHGVQGQRDITGVLCG
jgi:hypothetical protein